MPASISRHLLQIREIPFNVDIVDVSLQLSMEQTLFSLWLKGSTNTRVGTAAKICLVEDSGALVFWECGHVEIQEMGAPP